MVETAEGLANVDAIAATPGVDAIYIGPGDLGLGLGMSAWSEDWDEDQARAHADAIATILAACQRHGVAPGIHMGSGATARQYLDQGFLMVTVANELGLITVGGRAELAIARGTVASGERAIV